MRRNVIADELIMVGLIITQSPSCARTFPLAEETRLRFWTKWAKKGDVLQMLIFSSMEETASVDLCNSTPRNSSPSFHSSSPVSL